MPMFIAKPVRTPVTIPMKWWAIMLVAVFTPMATACGGIEADSASAALSDEPAQTIVETPQPTAEPVQLPEASATPVVQPTSTVIPTSTPTPVIAESTATVMPTLIPTLSPIAIPTPPPAPLPTVTPIAVATPTLAHTAIATLSPTATPTPAPTSTPLPGPLVTLTMLPKASIVSYTPASAVTVKVGAQASLGVTLKNTGTIAWQYVVEAVVLDDQGIVIGQFNTALGTALQPGIQTAVTWNVQVLQSGGYWVQYSVWKDSAKGAGSMLTQAPAAFTKLLTGTPPVTPTPTPITSPTPIPTPTAIPSTPTSTPFPTATPTPTPSPTPTPPPPQAPAPVASIISYTPASLVTVTVGSQTSLGVTVKNTGTVAWQYVVEAVVLNDQGIVIGQFNTVLGTALQPGTQTVVTWSVGVLQSGDYWVQYSVWKASGGGETDLLDQKPVPSAKLITGQIPPTVTATPITSPTPIPTSTPIPPTPTPTPFPTVTPTPTPVPTATPLLLLPPSPMASIVSYTPASVAIVTLGLQASLGVTFQNTGKVAWQFVAEATVWNTEGIVVGQFNTALGTALQPGLQTTVTWSVGVLQAGDYWVQYSVRKTSGAGGANLLDQKPVPSVKLITGVAPTPTPTPTATP
jgi:hypothetical protein